MTKQIESPPVSQAELEKLIVTQSRNNLIDFEIATNPDYIPAWYHEIIARELEHIEKNGDRDYKILIVTLPPRHGKSQMCSIDFPAWYLGRNPKKEIITASYSADLAQEFGGKTRAKVDSDEFKTIFPEVELREDERARGKWKTKQGGSYTAVGVGGSATGRGADIFFIDDPVKNREEAESELYQERNWNWFTSVAFTRLSPKGVIVVIMTRWHTADLAGKILAHPEISKRTKLIWLPAIAELDDPPFRKQGEALWPARFNLSILEEIKETLGPYDFSALYQGSPVPSEGRLFKPEWVKYIDESTVQMMNCRRFLTVDTAMSKNERADFTGFTDNRVNSENFWHIKAWQMKIGPEELVETLFTLYSLNRYETIGIEKTTYTQGLKPYLDAEQRKRNTFLPIVELDHKQSAKETRIKGLLPLYASGTIFHIRGECKVLEEQQAQFPMGAHDDVIDACFVGETMVLCERGNVPIKDVVVGDRVMTRQGWKKVLLSTETGIKEVITNIGLTGTRNHPVITKEGIKDLQYVDESSILYIWNQKLSSIEEKSIPETLILKDGNIESTTGDMINGKSHQWLFIDKFGLTTLVQYLRNIIFTIRIVILLIMNWIIWNVSRLLTMLRSMAIVRNDLSNRENLLPLDENTQRNGISQQRADSGIKNMSQTVFSDKKVHEFALNVWGSIRQNLERRQSIVERNVEQDGKEENLEKRIQSITSQQIKRREKVYNLEVEDAHEYFANGVLVHNCAYQLQIADGAKSTNVSIYVPVDF